MDIDDSFDFYCPKNGKLILGPAYFEVSAPTTFCFSPEANEFDSIAEEYQPLWKKLEAEYGKEEFGDELFKQKYHSEKTITADGWRHDRIQLLPLNPAFTPIEIERESSADLAIIGEFIRLATRR